MQWRHKRNYSKEPICSPSKHATFNLVTPETHFAKNIAATPCQEASSECRVFLFVLEILLVFLSRSETMSLTDSFRLKFLSSAILTKHTQYGTRASSPKQKLRKMRQNT